MTCKAFQRALAGGNVRCQFRAVQLEQVLMLARVEGDFVASGLHRFDDFRVLGGVFAHHEEIGRAHV